MKWLALCSWLVLAACSSDGSPNAAVGGGPNNNNGGGGGGTGTTDAGSDASTDSGDPAALCTDKGVGPSDEVQELVVRSAPPPPIGGTIDPGSYILSELTEYSNTPPDGGSDDPGSTGSGSVTTNGLSARKALILSADGSFQRLEAEGPTGQVPTTVNVTGGHYAFEPTSITLTASCGKNPVQSFPFSSSGGAFSIFTSATRRETYIRQ